MRRMCGTLASATLAVLAILVTGGRAAAQSDGDLAARAALVLTPIGALPPLATNTIEREAQNGASLALRYGYLPGIGSGSATNNVAATAMLPFGLGSSVSLTGGIFAPTCSGCSTGLMLGVGGDTRLAEVPFGTGTDGSRLTFSLNGELGYGKPRNAGGEYLVSGVVGVPIGWLIGDRTRNAMRLVPFITPEFGFGGIYGADPSIFSTGFETRTSETGSRFMLGGGIAMYNRSSTIGFSIGFQYVAIPSSQAQIGLALIFGR